jgi:O-antigen/teichoic acid export membrane protein
VKTCSFADEGILTKSFVSIGLQSRGGFRELLGERILLHNFVVGGGTVVAGLLGVAFQSLASHQLKPADYGSVFAVITLITLIGLPSSAFTLLVARETSKGQASGHQAPSANLLRRGNRALMLFGTGLAVLIVVGSPVIARFLDIPSPMLIVAATSVPFSLALPLLMGEFQGEQRFIAFSLLLISQAGIKVVAAIGLGLVFGPVGVIAGISVAAIGIYLVARWMLRAKLRLRVNLPWWRPAARYLVVVLPSTLALAVLLSADVLAVKHFYPTGIAGDYAAVAALGRAIFWGATGVATVLFPKIVFRGASGQSGSHLVGISLVLVGLAGLAGLAVLFFASRWLLTLFAGAAYGQGAAYLPAYAFGMIMLGAAAVLIATHQTRGTPGFLAVLIPLAALEPALLSLFHQNLWQVVVVVDISMSLVAGGLGALYLVQERAQLSTAQIGVADEAGPTHLAQVR